MWEIYINEPSLLRPKTRRKSRAGTWLIRCGFLSIHGLMLTTALAWVEGWPPFSGPGGDASAASTPTLKPAPSNAPPANSVAGGIRARGRSRVE